VFGVDEGYGPKAVKAFKVVRQQDRSNANLSWK